MPAWYDGMLKNKFWQKVLPMNSFISTCIALALLAATPAFSQSWPTIGGNNQKNGLSEITGPQAAQEYWRVTSPNTSLWGNSVFTHGDLFVQSRVVFTPSYTCKVELRSLATGDLLWEQQVNDDAILYAVGFTDDAVYATDYGSGTLYALNVSDGSVMWFVSTTMFPGNTGLVYACDGDPVEFGKRMDRVTGEILWSNDYPIPVGPDGGYVVVGNTYYHWTGYINTAKTLIAIDIETGQTKYTSEALPGDGDQEIDLIAGSDGTIYITRDGGALHAFTDDGTGFVQKWSRPSGPIIKGVGWDGSLYAVSSTNSHLIRLDPQNGATVDSSQIVVDGLLGYLAVGADSTVYVSTGQVAGSYYALSADLQTVKWTVDVPYNYYSGPALAKDGIMVTVGAGQEIVAYRSEQELKPVVDFVASAREILSGETVDFFDQSSFAPTSWLWSFPGSNTPQSTEHHPTGIIYDTLGTYEVTLVASNMLGSDSVVKSCYIEVQSATGVVSAPLHVPEAFELLQNYPNPFNPTTVIRYALPVETSVSLRLYDVLGQEVVSLVDEYEETGYHQVTFDGSRLASGQYFYRLKAGSFAATKRLLLLK
jgi:PKD repeat protein